MTLDLPALYATLARPPEALAAVLRGPLSNRLRLELLTLAWEGDHREAAQVLEADLAQREVSPAELANHALPGLIRGGCVEALPRHWAQAESRVREKALEKVSEQSSADMRHAVLNRARQDIVHLGPWRDAMSSAIFKGRLGVADEVLRHVPEEWREVLHREGVESAIRHDHAGWALAHADGVAWTTPALERALDSAVENRREVLVSWLLTWIAPEMELDLSLKHATQVGRQDWVEALLAHRPGPSAIAGGLRAAMGLDPEDPLTLAMIECFLPHINGPAFEAETGQDALTALSFHWGDTPNAVPVARRIAQWLQAGDEKTLTSAMSTLRTQKNIHLYGACLEVAPTENRYALGILSLLDRMEQLSNEQRAESGSPFQADPQGFQAKLVTWARQCRASLHTDQKETFWVELDIRLNRLFPLCHPQTQRALVQHFGAGDYPQWKAVERALALERQPPTTPTRPRRRA